jgi:hypothetical protein
MKHNNLNNRNTNFKITATKILSLTTIILVLVGTTVTTTTTTPLAYAWIDPTHSQEEQKHQLSYQARMYTLYGGPIEEQ